MRPAKESPAVDRLRASFVSPTTDSRPTPLFWWSGADLDLTRLEWQLDQLSEKGIGGTIVGYSHLPDGTLDHGNPEPLSAPWWGLFRQFVAASAQRGMTVGIQDYGIIGNILLQAGDKTRSLDGGCLQNSHETVTGPAVITRTGSEDGIVSRRAISPDGGRLLDVSEFSGDTVRWTVPEGEWILSTTRRVQGQIGLSASFFDPLHPAAGSTVIELFYARFAEELGGLFGDTFTTFFQDELDFGLVTPMWNALVGDRLELQGFNPSDSVHLLWHGEGQPALTLRASYRDAVVELLQAHYFRPIFEWNESHSTLILMDQLSRGDLRLGHDHYADFMETMAWYHGPGNDDPDLTGPRNLAAFRTSASIAHLHDRPRVTNEAFHSSGWGVTPQMIVNGLNVGFAAGANQVLLHGLNYTTNAGWWEWASPDFHFRQPWWPHSAPLWTYISRISEVLRAGEGVCEVGIIDPTPELDFDSTVGSPEVASSILAGLSLRAINADLLPQTYLDGALVVDEGEQVSIRVLNATFGAIIVPTMTTMRKAAVDALRAFVDAGGVVIAVGIVPIRTEFGPVTAVETLGWHLVADEASLPARIRELIDVAVNIADESGPLMHAHRRVGDSDFFFLVNPAPEPLDVQCDLRRAGSTETWDPWTGSMHPDPATQILDLRGLARCRLQFRLQPGESRLLIQARVPQVASPAMELDAPENMDLSSGWKARIVPNLDNRHGDFSRGGPELPIATYHLEIADQPGGPWRPALVDHGVRFLAAGPISRAEADPFEHALTRAGSSRPDFDLGQWRPYEISLNSGIPSDPYLLDRDTGPHGLKGVPDEFLDPHALDAEPIPGSFYYFWSTVESAGEKSTITSQGRSAHTIWLNGQLIVEAQEIAAAQFPPWGLRDMSTKATRTAVELRSGVNSILVRVTVSRDQPSRLAVVVGGTTPAFVDTAQLIWWQGDEPAANFQVPEVAVIGWFKIAVPIGALHALIPTRAELISAPGSVVSKLDSGYVLTPSKSAEFIEFALQNVPGNDGPLDAGAVTGPPIWETDVAPVELKSWRELGLQDYSGMVRYERSLDIEKPLPRVAQLVLTGIEGSLRITVNQIELGIVYSPKATLRIEHVLSAGTNTIEIEAANTLANLFSHLPSPYSRMQVAGGGFTGACMVVDKGRL